VDGEPGEESQVRHHQHTADAHGANEQADECGDRRKKEGGRQPAANATSSLVSSTASFFIRA
jgi:hypothetical protein